MNHMPKVIQIMQAAEALANKLYNRNSSHWQVVKDAYLQGFVYGFNEGISDPELPSCSISEYAEDLEDETNGK